MRIRNLSITALLLAGVAQPAFAQSAQPADASGAAADIIVTGTRADNRSALESLAPVDVVSSKSLALSPSRDLNDKLAQIVPSFNVQRMPGADGAIFNRPATLRNLSPDETLVLVNGHRRHRSAFVDVVNQGAQAIDLGQIPAVAIGHVEVLRDGASAQYGSDAIGGVINLLLDDTPGTVLTAQTGQYYAGDGFNLQLAGKTGFALPGDGRLTVTGDYTKSNATDRSVGLRNKIGQPDLQSYHVTYNLTLPVNDRTQIYSFGTLSHGSGWSQFGYRSAQNGDTVFNSSFYQTGDNAIYPDWTLTSVYPDGLISTFGESVKDGEVVFGVKSDITDTLKVDVSADYGRNSINFRVKNSINASLGPLSPTRFDAGTVVSSQSIGAIDAVWSPEVGLAKPLSVAFGGSFTHETFQAIAGDVASYTVGPLSDLPAGAYGFPGLSPTSAGKWSRDNEAAYLDIEADVTSKLTFGAAGRFEHFSDFGSNFSYKFSGRYQVIPALAVRATYNTGFHAPAPGQQHFTKVASSPDATQPAPYPTIFIGLVSPTDPLAAPFGGKPLKAEKSRNISAGLVLQPFSGFSITADYYHINIDDRIGLTPQLSLPDGSTYDAIQFLNNGFDTASNGVDVVASWTTGLGSGRLTLTGAYNYNKTKVTHFDPVVVTNISRPAIEDARPNHTAIGTIAFEQGPIHATARARYYGSFVDVLPIDQSLYGFQNQKVPPVTFFDLNVSYDFASGSQITVGAENLFDTYPARNTSLLGLLGYKYPTFRPYEADGGRWYVRLSQKF